MEKFVTLIYDFCILPYNIIYFMNIINMFNYNIYVKLQIRKQLFSVSYFIISTTFCII